MINHLSFWQRFSWFSSVLNQIVRCRTLGSHSGGYMHCFWHQTGFLLGLFFDPEDGADRLLSGMMILAFQVATACYPCRSPSSSSSKLNPMIWRPKITSPNCHSIKEKNKNFSIFDHNSSKLTIEHESTKLFVSTQASEPYSGTSQFACSKRSKLAHQAIGLVCPPKFFSFSLSSWFKGLRWRVMWLQRWSIIMNAQNV
jgi:hypothetical protein